MDGSVLGDEVEGAGEVAVGVVVVGGDGGVAGVSDFFVHNLQRYIMVMYFLLSISISLPQGHRRVSVVRAIASTASVMAFEHRR